MSAVERAGVDRNLQNVMLVCFGAVALLVLARFSTFLALAVAALLVVVLSMELPLVSILVPVLFVRELFDGSSGSNSRASSSLKVTAVAAGLIILFALASYLRRLAMPTSLLFATVGIGLGTLVAVHLTGFSALSVREGIRELSIVAIALIVLNSPALALARLVRIVQLLGVIPALVAIYQFVTNTGMVINHHHRALGTFSHPNSAAAFFAIPLLMSAWSVIDRRSGFFDLGMVGLYGVALMGTGSLGGLGAALTMLVVLGAKRRAKLGSKAVMFIGVLVLLVAFALSPLGSFRLSSEANLSTGLDVGKGQSTNSFQWRLYNWRSLLPVWHQHKLLGAGLGTTTIGDSTNGKLPHNEYVRYLVETGLVGLVLLLVLLYVLVRRLNRICQLADPELAAGGVIALAITAGLAVNALVANTVLYTPTIYLGVFVVSAILRANRPSFGAPPTTADPPTARIPAPPPPRTSASLRQRSLSAGPRR